LGRASTEEKAQRNHFVVDGRAKPGHDAVPTPGSSTFPELRSDTRYPGADAFALVPGSRNVGKFTQPAYTSLRARPGNVVKEAPVCGYHCEERSDEAIQGQTRHRRGVCPWIASPEFNPGLQ
jgi:hypothetical protein